MHFSRLHVESFFIVVPFFSRAYLSFSYICHGHRTIQLYGNRKVIVLYLLFQFKPLMNLKIFATVYGLMHDTKFDWQLPSSLTRAICFEHRIHSPDVTLVLWLTSSHTWVKRQRKKGFLFTPLAACVHTGCSTTRTKPLRQLNIKYKIVLTPF